MPLLRKSLALLPLLVAASSFADNAPLPVAFMYGGPASNPVGWVHGHEVARQALEHDLPGQVTTHRVEKITSASEAQGVLRQLVRQGDRMVVAASFNFMGPVMQAARENPGVVYLCASCYKQAPNVGNYLASTYQGRFVAGILAGHMSRSGIAAYIGSYPLPEVIRDANAFLLGMRTVNPKAVLKVVWVNSWDDPGKEIEAAQLMIQQGADVLTAHNDSASVVSAAERAGVYSVAYGSDMRQYAPKGQLTAIVQNWEPYFRQAAEAVRSGSFKGGDYWGDVADGVVTLAPFNDSVPQTARDDAQSVLEQLRERQRDVFAGPIRDRSGKEVVPTGATLGHAELAAMDYFVEGVEGSLQ